MNNKPKQNQKEEIQASPDSERSVRDLIRAISCREIVFRTLDVNLRQACIEELTLEGLTTGQIADQLNTSDRTVRRYLQDIRRANALDRDPETVKQAVGGLTDRVILNYYTAKRLAITLSQLIRRHEEQFGELELDVSKRSRTDQ